MMNAICTVCINAQGSTKICRLKMRDKISGLLLDPFQQRTYFSNAGILPLSSLLGNAIAAYILCKDEDRDVP
jgi:hypothetical protein